jgi:putative PIN family toxin of toxin-antitoxin system
MVPVPRVFVDTNILISAVSADGPPRKLLLASIDGRLELALAEYVLREAQDVVDNKMPGRKEALAMLLAELRFETIPLPSKQMMSRHRKYVAHDEDAPVLASAVLADADYVVSGDKKFSNKATREMIELISCSELLLLLPLKGKKLK